MTPGELFSLLMCQLRNGVMSGKSQYVFGGISHKRIMINISYAVCLTEHLLFSLGQRAGAGSQFDTWYKTLGNLKLSEVKKTTSLAGRGLAVEH